LIQQEVTQTSFKNSERTDRRSATPIPHVMNREAPQSSASTAKKGGSNKQETSIKIFRGVVGRECYDDWLGNRAEAPRDPERTFQRSLGNYVTSVDGRQLFSPKEEEAILKMMHREQVWCVSDQIKRH